MRTILVTGLAAFAGLAGWASPAGAGLFSITGPVIAIFAGDLFLGEVEGNFDGSGTIRIQSRAKPDVTCRGQFTYSTELGDAGNMRCSDGRHAPKVRLNFVATNRPQQRPCQCRAFFFDYRTIYRVSASRVSDSY